MRFVRLTTTPDTNAAPPLLRLLAASPHVEEARLLDWNVAGPDDVTVFFSVDGDAAAFREALPDTAFVETADVVSVDEGQFYLLAQVQAPTGSVVEGVFETMTRSGLVVRKPVVYRDGVVDCHVVGEPASLQAAMDAAPGDVSVCIDEIGSYPCDRVDSASLLSERQREAVTAALELGYYDSPRRATHEDIAAELDCAPSTVSEHLQKAERKFVRSSMDVEDAVEGSEPELPTH